MKIVDYLAEVYFLERELASGSQEQLGWCVSSFSSWLGRPALLADLTADTLNRLLVAKREAWSAKTRRNRRGDLIGIARSAYATGHLDARIDADRVRLIKVPRRPPECWNDDELARVIRAARTFRGRFFHNGVPEDVFFEAWMMVGREVGPSVGEQAELTWTENVDETTGVVRITRPKTGFYKIGVVTPRTLEMLKAIVRPADYRVFPFPYTRKAFSIRWWKLVEIAGVRKFGPNKLRHCFASYVAKKNPLKVGEALAHSPSSGNAMAYKSYVDPSIAFADRGAIQAEQFPAHLLDQHPTG